MAQTEQSAIDAAKRALGITLTGDWSQDSDAIRAALGTASEGQKAAFTAIRYGNADTYRAGIAPITAVVSGNDNKVHELDDPSVSWASGYYENLNVARREAVATFDEIMSTVGFGNTKPTATSADIFGPRFEVSRTINPSDVTVGVGGGRAVVVNDQSLDDGGSTDPVRRIAPRDRGLDVPGGGGGGSIPTRKSVAVPQAISSTSGGTDTGGGTGGSGGGGGGGTSGAGSGTGTGDTNSVINRLMDLVAQQYGSAGGGASLDGGLAALPTQIDSGGSGTSPAVIIFIVGGIAVLAYLWFKHKKKNAPT